MDASLSAPENLIITRILQALEAKLPSMLEPIIETNLKNIEGKLEGVNAQLANINESIGFISSQYDTMLEKLNLYHQLVNDLQKDTKVLKKELLSVKNENIQLKNNLDNLEQYGRRDCLEIRGIPAVEGLHTSTIVEAVGKLMNVETKPEDISISHRLRTFDKYSKDGKTIPPSIIVKFVRRTVRDKFYMGRKCLGSKSVRDLNLPKLIASMPQSEQTRGKPQRIFIAESLTQRRKLLFNEALKFKKENHFKFIWTQNGITFIRKIEESPIHRIQTMRDLENLAPAH